MREAQNLDWWMHELYQHTKEFISSPTREREQRLVALLGEFRTQHEKTAGSVSDEHEVLMDYR